MPIRWFDSARDRTFAAWKRLLSFRKRAWGFGDYPVVVRAQKNGFIGDVGPRLKQHRYWAVIVNWWVLTDGGETPEDAVRNLAMRFEETRAERLRERKTMPRPGTSVPIEFAPEERVGTHVNLKNDFIRRVLGLDWAWISDQSSLWDFHTEETNDKYYAKINELYGVDVSDINSGNLAEILDRIASAQLDP